MTLEDVFIKKLKDEPVHLLELSRDFLLEHGNEQTYVRLLIDKYILSWMDASEENEELGRRVLGLELVNVLRPV